MSKTDIRYRYRQNRTHSQSALASKRNLPNVCERVEDRVLLSTATFGTPASISVPGARAPIVQDRFAGSGTPYDVAVATPTSVRILTGTGTGAFTLGQNILLPPQPAAISPFNEGDFSGSGTDDIVLDSTDPSSGDGDLTYETNDGTGNFTAGTVTNITDGGAGFTPIVGKAADLNGDGETDLAIVGKPGSGNELVLAIMLSNGTGGFTETDYPIAGSNANGNLSNEEVLTDFTDELVVYDGSSGNYDVFTGPGDGTFTQLTPVPITANLLIGGTFNDNQDLVVANGDQISVLQNQNDGTFQPDPQGPITMPGAINAIAIGDFNLDGNNDIATNQGILFGNGDETFNTTVEPLPISVTGGGGSQNTLQAVYLGNGRQGLVGFSSAGNAIASAVNDSQEVASIDLSSNNNPANLGSDVQFTASIAAADTNYTGTPTGTVMFYNGSTLLATEQLSDGSATYDAGSSLDGANNSITAVYGGDSNFGSATSVALIQVTLSSTSTTLTSNNNPSGSGADVIFTATVTGNDGAGDSPSGNVEFYDNGVDLGGGDLTSTGTGAATATFDTMGTFSVGTHPVTAQYQGDSNFGDSLSSTLMQTITQPSLSPVVAATTLPGAIVGGTSVHGNVTVQLTNETAVATTASGITIFASTNGSIAGAAEIAGYAKGIALKANQEKTLKIPVKSFPATLGDGTYQLLVQVTNSLSQQSNSTSGPSVNVASPFVQLAGVAGTGTVKPNTVKAGKAIMLTIALTNSGNITSQPASLNIGLSTDGMTEGIMIENATANLKIKPGHTGTLHIHVIIPSSVPAASYQPFVSITDDGAMTTVIGQLFTVEV